MSVLTIRLKKYDEYYDKNAFILLAYAMFFGAGTYGIKAIVVGIGLEMFQSAASFLIYLIWFILLFKMLKNYAPILMRIIICEVIIGILFLVSYHAFPFTQEFHLEYAMFLRQIFVVYIPAGVIAHNIADFHNCFEHTRKVAWFGSILLVVSLLFGYLKVNGYQYWGVHLSPLLLLLYGSYLSTKRVGDLLLCIIEIFLIFLGGRQSLLVTLIGLIMLYFFMNDNKKTKRTLVIIASLTLVLLVYLASDFLLMGLIKLLNLVNINSRTLDMLASGELTSMSSRTYIYESAIRAITENGSKISGLFADRYYIRRYGSWIAYPHNIFFEFMLDFGIIGGISLSILLMVFCLKGITCGSKERKAFVALIGSLVMVRLFVSSSFVIEGLFYTMLGLLFGKKEKFVW